MENMALEAAMKTMAILNESLQELATSNSEEIKMNSMLKRVVGLIETYGDEECQKTLTEYLILKTLSEEEESEDKYSELMRKAIHNTGYKKV
ncbi:hypothetical protein AYI68_g3696 [Smittium mucronatum]|uniref:Uncharacterized protein n=1 Tax=Smittium mucronatum TaxID=133383 RepID=A0A1R0GZ63_9FUNG|nr:hypothetical protein AYI68_g3696 [Smittium mucronatum]